MKRKLLTVLLTLITAFCLCFAVSACDSGNSSNSGSGTEQSNPQKPDEGEEQKPDKGEEQTPDEGVEQKPDEGGEQKPEHVHSFIDYVYNNDATCTEDGTETAACTCGVTDTRLKEDTALGHDYQQFEAKPATCADAGYEAYEECKRCGASTFGGYIPALHVKYYVEKESCSVADLSSACTDSEIVIPETYMGKYVTSIGWMAFENCSGLESIEIPDSVTLIGDDAFEDCSRLTSIEIPNSMTEIGSYAFAYCSGLKSIEIPNSVIEIGHDAFWGCNGLIRVYIHDLTAWCMIDFETGYANPLHSANHLYMDNVEVKELIIPNEITEIKPCAFDGCSGLTSVTIGSGVTSIGRDAFNGCSGLTGVYIADLSAWCKIVFEGAGSNPLHSSHHLYMDNVELKELTIPDKITEIKKYAFGGYSGLTSVTIPDSVTAIGDFAFYGCSGLTSITIPDSVTSIGRLAFSSCNQIIQKEGNVDYVDQWAVDCYILATEVTVRAGTKGIADYTFEDCKSLKSVTIPESVMYIGQYAFQGCLPESVTVEGSAEWQVSKTSDFASAETVDVTDPVKYVDYFTFDYIEYFWKRS